jgi:hypothetical protein
MTHQRNLFPDDPEQQHMFDEQAQGDPPAARRPLTPADIDRVRDVAGFPIATDEAIIALSDPPHYTACPNPFLPEIVARWQQERDASGDDDYHREPFAFDVSEGKNDHPRGPIPSPRHRAGRHCWIRRNLRVASSITMRFPGRPMPLKLMRLPR